ncbi:MAG: phospholipase D-like domain-containing protein [bacterium]
MKSAVFLPIVLRVITTRCSEILTRVFLGSVLLILLSSGGGYAQSGNRSQDKADVENQEDRILTLNPVSIEFLENRNYARRLLQQVDRARSHISIGAYLFKLSHNQKASVMILFNALASARRRGVLVEVLLEQSDYDKELNKINQVAKKRLEQRGIRVRLDSLSTRSHSKLVIIDREWTFIGSHNLTSAALRYNNEASLLVRSKPFAEAALNHLERIR